MSQFQSFRRVQLFLNDQSDRLGSLNQTPARVALDDVVTKLEGHTAEQSTTRAERIGDTNRARELSSELQRQHMQPIARYARANMRGVPDYKALTVVVGSNEQGERLVAAATAMAAAVKPYAQQLIDAGFPKDFIETLVAAASAVRGTLDVRSTRAGKGAGATKGIAAELARGGTAVATLNAVVVKRLAGDAAALAEWRSARRVAGKRGPRRAAAVSGTPSEAPKVVA